MTRLISFAKRREYRLPSLRVPVYVIPKSVIKVCNIIKPDRDPHADPV